MKTITFKAWAIVDIQKRTPRACYADEDKDRDAVAIFFTRPTVPQNWKAFKRVVRCQVKITL
jgi:hypothetical protein